MVDNNEKSQELKANSKSLEVPSHKIDEFDETLDKEISRTDEAKRDAEYNRKKYAQLKDKYRDLETERNELLETIEEKNKTIARLKRRDNTARENSVVENRQEQAIFNIVADRMLRKRT
jgi:hypothetical protein